VVVIGGTDKEIEVLHKKFPRVRFLGERPYRELKHNLAAADVVVLPTSAKSIIGKKYTSPLKLFAYMASGRPIVASKVPSAREVLSEGAAFWFEPDDADDLARAIRAAYSENSHERASVAQRHVARYTWSARANAILAHL
jgi:glycosyltransferase involved in cell wall biosynthesis